jgi:hypothetical protein
MTMADPSSTTPRTIEDLLSSVIDIVTEETGKKSIGAKIISNVQE